MTSAADKILIKGTQEKLLMLPFSVRALEHLLMLLPRRFEHVELIPEGDVEVLDAENGEFEAIGVDPRFGLHLDPMPSIGAWYYLEAALTRHSGNRTAKIYFDRGQGYTESESIFIPSNLRGTIREVIYIPEGVSNLRWDPMETRGWFSQSHLVIHQITPFESYIRRVWRVFFDFWHFRYTAEHARSGLFLWNALFDLNYAYAWSANLRINRTVGVDYQTFIKLNDTLTAADYRAIDGHIKHLTLRPLLSIIMPVRNPPLNLFREALDSVITQSYPNWELCLAVDASTNPEVEEIITEFMCNDSRIKAVFHPGTDLVSVDSNSALALAIGEFVVLMDQDGLIPSHTLYHIAVEINRYPDACLIYTDEDKTDEFGHRHDPHFKSDWNPDLFYSQNMIGNLGVYRTSLVREMNGFRIGYDEAQHYDLALRCVDKISADKIRHIPRVLYHRRTLLESTALPHSAENLVADRGLKALQDHFSNSDVRVDQAGAAGMYRVRYPLPEELPLVSLIIPTKDQVRFLRQCIESIRAKTDYPNFEVLVLDNQSHDPETLAYLDSLHTDQRFKVIKYDAPYNYSAINNYAVTLARGEIIALVNNDIEVMAGSWLSEMVSHVLRPGIGVVGAKLLYPDLKVQHAGVVLGIGGLAGHAHKFIEHESWGYFGRANLIQNFSAVTAACFLVRKSVYELVGGLDEKNLPVAFNDVDFCIKVREHGLRNLYTPYALLIHHESASRGRDYTREKQTRASREILFMKEKWGLILENDPYYNPNLTLASENFSIGGHHVSSSHHGYPLKTKRDV